MEFRRVLFRSITMLRNEVALQPVSKLLWPACNVEPKIVKESRNGAGAEEADGVFLLHTSIIVFPSKFGGVVSEHLRWHCAVIIAHAQVFWSGDLEYAVEIDHQNCVSFTAFSFLPA